MSHSIDAILGLNLSRNKPSLTADLKEQVTKQEKQPEGNGNPTALNIGKYWTKITPTPLV